LRDKNKEVEIGWASDRYGKEEFGGEAGEKRQSVRPRCKW
jgi:hypothetical protein